MAVRQIKVVCGLNNETNILLKERLGEAAAEKGLKLQIVSRYRKEGVYQYVMEHPDYQYVILQEIMQSSSPYRAEDAALLTDERNVKVILVLNKSHAGSQYMRILYAAGILDALYEEDAYAERIVELLRCGRTRKEARRYYGIESVQDLERALQVIDEERLKSFLGYIENGGPHQETLSRYEFIASRMTAVQNLYLIQNMEQRISDGLKDSGLFRYYYGLIEEKSKKRVALPWRKKKTVLEPGEILGHMTDVAEKVQFPEQVFSEPNVDSENVAAESKEMAQTVVPEDKNEEIYERAPISREYEEESLYDLFEEDGTFGIFHLMDREQHNVDLKAELRPESISKPRPESEKKPEEKEVTEEEVRRPSKQKTEDRRRPQVSKAVVFGAGTVFLCLLIVLIFLIRIYGEREIPVIEEIPVSSEEAKGMEEQETTDRSESTEDLIPEEQSLNEENQVENTETEEENEQEEAKEAEPEAADGTDMPTEEIESDEGTTEAASRAESRQRTEAPAAVPQQQRREGELEVSPVLEDTAGSEESSQGAVTVDGPLVDIYTEPLQENAEEASGSAMDSESCNGKIYSGDQLSALATELRQNGFQVYVITRINGEGYFSTEQIQDRCDPACSFLASVSGDMITFTEQ